MKNIKQIFLLGIFLLIYGLPFDSQANYYPEYLYSNEQIKLAYAHMGMGAYVDKTSVVIEDSNPPYYKLAANVIDYDWDNNKELSITTYYFTYDTDAGCIYIDGRGPYYNRPDSQAEANQRPVEIAKLVWEAAYHSEWN